MAEGRKPVLETHRIASNVLSTHLKESRGRSRKKSPLPPPSEKEIREEVRRILEQFLKKQVENNNEEQTAIPTSFQKVVVEDVIETEGPGITSTSREGSRYSSKTSCAKCRSEASQSIPGGSIRSLTDDTIDFPFIDDVDDVGDEQSERDYSGASNSLPSSIPSSVKIQDKNSQLALSKSLSPSKLRDIIESGPPLTKISASDDDFDSSSMSGLRQRNREEPGIARGRQRLKSGTESSDDTDYEEEVISPGRKKKSIFTRFKEHMNRSLSRGRMKANEEKEKDVKKTKSKGWVLKQPKARKKKEEGSSVDKMGQVVQHVHTHKHGHIQQHHYTNGNKSGVLLEKEVWESTDVTGDSEIKHEDRHSNIKESKELPGDGDNRIMRSLKKITSFRKSKKGKTNTPPMERIYSLLA